MSTVAPPVARVHGGFFWDEGPTMSGPCEISGIAVVTRPRAWQVLRWAGAFRLWRRHSISSGA